MKSGWPMVALGEVIRHRKEFAQIDDTKTYKRCRVQLHAQGVVLRDEVPGLIIKTKSQQPCRSGEFLVAEIDAKHGGYGIVPQDLDGAIVSSHYFLFEIDNARLDRQFLGYFAKTPWFSEQVAAQGTTNYAAIRPSHVLAYQIPLPPIEEQRRIVARIDALAAKIAEARQLHIEATDALEALSSQTIEAIIRWENTVPIHSLLREPTLNGIGLRPNGSGHRILRISAGTSQVDATIDEDDFKLIEVPDGDVVRYRLMPGDLFACRFNGNLRFVGRFSRFVGRSSEILLYPDKLIRFRVDPTRIMPEFVCLAMNCRHGRKQIESFCATTAGNIGISATELKTVSIPAPPISEQRGIVTYLNTLSAKTASLKLLQQHAAAKLDALLPSILDKAFKGELLPTPASATVSVSTLLPARARFNDLADLVVRAYFDVRDGWSTEYLLSSPNLTRRFVEQCAALGAERTPRDLLAALINARRAGALKGSEKARKFSIPRDQMDLFSFASEMAFRCIQDHLQSEQQRDLTVDAMLTSPTLATEFDQFASRLAPGYEPLQYRWTAITLRKDRKFSGATQPVPLFDELGRVDDVRVQKLPETEGVYCVTVEQKPLFVAVADNLRTQIDRLLEGTKKRVAPDWISDTINGALQLHISPMPGCSVVDREIARGRVLRKDFTRLNFFGGLLFERSSNDRR